MRTVFRLVALGAVALGATWVSAGTAVAAAPSNDTFAGATPAAIGFSQVLDTTEATTDANDTQLNASCGAPATAASVWYAVTGTDTGVVVDVSGSSYSAGVLVGVGTEGNLTTVACGPGTVGFFAAAGETYYVLAIDDQLDGGGNGGMLDISFNQAPPPPTVDFTVNPTGTFNSKTGAARISGTYSCTNGDFVDIQVNATQAVGRVYVLGFGEFFDFGTCDGVTRTWAADVFGQNGKFAGGKALTLSFSASCGPFDCAFGFDQSTVQLKGGSKK
jgi:hypothetical protein